jgi:cysteine desulfurase
MLSYFGKSFGNPGSHHSFGQAAMAVLDASRETVAGSLGADFRQIIFTGSATEANNLVLRGVARSASGKIRKPRIIVSAIEHESVLETARDLERSGFSLTVIPADASGIIDLEKLESSLSEDAALVSIMYANNETGAVQPVPEISKIIKKFRGDGTYPLFHTDAVQAFQFLDCNPEILGADFITISSHKIYGPKGVGALYARDKKLLSPVITGGGQEFGMRSGTENIPLIAGFAEAARLAVSNRKKESIRERALKEHFWKEAKKIFPKAETNGSVKTSLSLPNIINIHFPGIPSQDMLTRLDLAGFAASSGSACAARSLQPSHVITAMGHPKDRALSSMRFSFGRQTKKQDINSLLAALKNP